MPSIDFTDQEISFLSQILDQVQLHGDAATLRQALALHDSILDKLAAAPDPSEAPDTRKAGRLRSHRVDDNRLN